MKDESRDGILVFLIFLVACLFVLAVIWMDSTAKARTYNRLTGAHVTTWDALTSELRVSAPPKESR